MALAINKFENNYWSKIVYEYFKKNRKRITLKELLNKVEQSIKAYKKRVNKEISINLYVLSPRVLRMIINIKSIKLKKIELLKKLLKKINSRNFDLDYKLEKDNKMELIINDKFLFEMIHYELIKARKSNDKTYLISTIKHLINKLSEQVRIIEKFYEPKAKELMINVFSERLDESINIIKKFREQLSTNLKELLESEYYYTELEPYDLLSQSATDPSKIKELTKKVLSKIKKKDILIINLSHGSNRLAALLTIGLELEKRRVELIPIRFSLHKNKDVKPQIQDIKELIDKIMYYIFKGAVIILDEDICSGESVIRLINQLMNNGLKENYKNKLYIASIIFNTRSDNNLLKLIDNDKIIAVDFKES